ncbi:MAG: class I adenylate-forming enzyme family protein [Lachnospiraceae bacterium]
MSLWKLFERSVRLYKDKTALVLGNSRISFYELYQLSCRMADKLLEKTKGKSRQKVFILSKNSINMVAVMLGCFKTNLVACPINWRLSYKELAVLLRTHEYTVLICDRENICLMQAACGLSGESESSVLMLEEMCDDKEEPCRNAAVECEPEDIAIQLFTSGSTGIPKAVCHTNAGLMSYVYTYSVESKWTQNEIYQTSANLFHMSGLSIIISLMVGSTTVFFGRFDLIEFLTVMEREKTTRISFIPTLVTRLLNDERLKDFSFASVKKIVYGGSPMNYTTVVQTMERFHCQLEQAYGATESCCMAVLLPEDHEDCAKGKLDRSILASAGKPLPVVKMRISKEDAYWEEGNMYGEVEVKSPFLCSADASYPGVRTEDGYYPTGDIGYIDHQGFLHLAGRKHDMIICGGENIYPQEVEDCIASMEEDVQQVCVLGLPDKVWGEIVAACVVRKRHSSLTENQLISYCRQHIASYKKPKKVFFMDSLPENSNGKVSRLLLREKLLKNV